MKTRLAFPVHTLLEKLGLALRSAGDGKPELCVDMVDAHNQIRGRTSGKCQNQRALLTRGRHAKMLQGREDTLLEKP